MKKALLAILLTAIIALPIQGQSRTNSFPSHEKHQALLRLEDVSPGGKYATLDDLGRLRAVFEYLQDENVPFHLAVISRSKLWKDGAWVEKGIDDPHPDEHLQKFIGLLQTAQQNGAVLGMHGYTHQYGSVKRGDGWHDTGVGYEFDIEDAPETSTVPYAVEKISKSLAAFEKADLEPAFWESPHYQDTRAQEEVFRSYIGVLYQPDYFSLKSFKDQVVHQDENTYGGDTTLGSVYVPAPLSYVTGQEDVERILKKTAHFQGLGAVFYHSFKEYDALEAVTGPDGNPEIRDGLPVYRYQAGSNTQLQQIVQGMRKQGWTWMSLHDVLPFSPAHRIDLPLGTSTEHLLFGDVTGSKQEALVVVDTGGRVSVLQGNYNWPRNRTQSPFATWLRSGLNAEDTPLLADVNGGGVADLIAYRPENGEVNVYLSNTLGFDAGKSYGKVQSGVKKIAAGDLNGDGLADLLLQGEQTITAALQQGQKFVQRQEETMYLQHNDAQMLIGDVTGDKRPELILYSPSARQLDVYAVQTDGEFRLLKTFDVPKPKRDGQAVLGDTNGDGRDDVIIVDGQNGIWEIWQGDAKAILQPHGNLYGPWARGERTAYSADLDGNGKADILSFDPEQGVLDISLSFRRGTK